MKRNISEIIAYKIRNRIEIAEDEKAEYQILLNQIETALNRRMLVLKIKLMMYNTIEALGIVVVITVVVMILCDLAGIL